MKELSIEEKAKAYDKVREKIALRFGSNVAEEIFSEFEESEDERIRKALIKAIKMKAFPTSTCGGELFICGQSFDKCIAWLEKHDQVKESLISQHENKICKETDDSLTSEDDKIKKGLIQYFNKFSLDTFAGLDPKKILAWLEKQGEQKPVNTVEPRFKINDKVIHKETGKIWTIHWYLADTNSYYVIDEEKLIHHYTEDVLEFAEQKPANSYCQNNCRGFQENGKCFADGDCKAKREAETINKLESKFNIGDWVVSPNGVYWHIDAIRDGRYQVSSDSGGSADWPLDTNIYHKFTIQDAKDGDVLHSPSHHLIWIYKDNEHYYACVNMNYVTKDIATNGLIIVPNDACPATKDEQTILFARMKEADYEWDAEKKELKEIEQ